MSIKSSVFFHPDFSLYKHMAVQTEQTKRGSGFTLFVQRMLRREVLIPHGLACAFSLLSLYSAKNKLSKRVFVSLYTPYRVYKLTNRKISVSIHRGRKEFDNGL